MESPNRTLIVVAGGAGARMQSDIPKQFLEIANEIILMRSIRVFYEFDPNMAIIVALPQEQIETWGKLCKEKSFSIPHTVVKGGQTRYHSVKNALSKAVRKGVIAVHDGVRPLVSQDTINAVFSEATINGNAVPFIDIHESIRQISGNTNKIVNRDSYKVIQTPQAFRADILIDAYHQEYVESFTDDASVVESAGFKINLIPGNRENIKITSPADLKIANAFLT